MAGELERALKYAKQKKAAASKAASKGDGYGDALAYHELYDQLEGMTIAAFYVEEDDHDPDMTWPTFVIHREDDGTYATQTLKLVLSRDPEGNGGGFAFIEPTE